MGIFEQFPYTNFHEINLDWLLREVKNALNGAVTSVNGRTGAITGLYDASNPPPYPVRSVNGQEGDVVLTFPVTSVNGRTGAITGLYDASNPPPYPVRSVNGKTGDVVTPFIDSGDGVLTLDTPAGAAHWSIEREITNSRKTEIQIGANTAGTAPEAYIRLNNADDSYVEKKLLTSDDIPSSAGVVSVNNQTGVVMLYGSNIPMTSLDNTPIAEKINRLSGANLPLSATDSTRITTAIQNIQNSLLGSAIPVSSTDSTTIESALQNVSNSLTSLSTSQGVSITLGRSFNRQMLAGFGYITNTSKTIWMYLPFNSIASTASACNLTAVTASIRTISGKYIVGDGADFTENLANATLVRVQGMLRLQLVSDTAFLDNDGGEILNNTPLMGFVTITGTTT